MNNETLTIKQTVLKVLRIDEGARANDNRLVYLTFKALGLPTDLEQIAEIGEFTIGSVTRFRRLYQSKYPELRPKQEITAKRRAKQLEFEEMNREERQ